MGRGIKKDSIIIFTLTPALSRQGRGSFFDLSLTCGSTDISAY
jgi:hypothetical protein